MSPHQVQLSGCAAEPLMGYLKALGVLRLIAEQKDPGALGFWRQGVFVLQSSLDEEGLCEFFQKEYRPTPIIVPWSGSMFFEVSSKVSKGPFRATPTAAKVIEAFLATDSARLSEYRKTLKIALETLTVVGIKGKEDMKDERKLAYLNALRARVPDSVVPWIDCCAVLGSDKATFSALLGSGGGSDGRTHFSDNYMQNLWEVLPDFDSQKGKNKASKEDQLRAALWGRACTELVPDRTSALFDGGAVGGPNAGQGFERVALGNPWGFILCLEGAMLLGGSLNRRQAAGEKSRAAFPFQTRLTPTIGDLTADKESAGRELWLPLWNKPVALLELTALLSEGRGSIGTKQAERGADFARAAASLGVDRGIESFQRYAIVKGRVGGENYNTSASLGQFEVRLRPEVDLLREVDGWLERFRIAVSDDTAPPRFKGVLRWIESSMVDYCRYGGPSRFAEILCALGQAERELAQGEKFREAKGLRPLAGLSPEWMQAANDGSIEYHLACAIGSVFDQSYRIGSIRSNLEPVLEARNKKGTVFGTWVEGHKSAAWSGADLVRNLSLVLDRRLLDGQKAGSTELPIQGRFGASLSAISLFLAGEVEESRIEQLLWGLVLLDMGKAKRPGRVPEILEPPPLPRAYGLLKLLFLPRALHWGGNEVRIRPEPSVISLLEAGRIGQACEVALRRLRASGLTPLGQSGRHSPIGGQEWCCGLGPKDAVRLAGALLIPISVQDERRIASLVLRPEEEPLRDSD